MLYEKHYYGDRIKWKLHEINLKKKNNDKGEEGKI